MYKYNWKNHYAVQLTELEAAGAFCHYEIKGKTGNGTVISCTVFPGIQAVYNDLNLFHCGRRVPETEEVVEINYCAEGRYECEVSSQYCFYAAPGDLSVRNAGRREAAGSFPAGRFEGLTLFIELAAAREQNAFILQETEIDLDMISLMAKQEPRRFYLRGREEIEAICRQMIPALTGHRLPLLKLRTLELLMLLSDPELLCANNMPPYLSQKNVLLAKNVRERIMNDLSCRLTLRQLSGELHASPTAIKRAFKNVYGESVREYLRSVRMQEAQNLLRKTDLPVAKVAELVGYANPGHFAVAFRETFAMTPRDYKKLVHSER